MECDKCALADIVEISYASVMGVPEHEKALVARVAKDYVGLLAFEPLGLFERRIAYDKICGMKVIEKCSNQKLLLMAAQSSFWENCDEVRKNASIFEKGKIIYFEKGNLITGIIKNFEVIPINESFIQVMRVFPMSEWGKMPEKQNSSTYNVSELKKYSVSSPGKE